MVLLSFFLNIFATMMSLNLLLRKVHLSLSRTMVLIHSSRFFLGDVEEVVWGEESGVGVCFGLAIFDVVCRGEGVGIGDMEWNNFRFLGGNDCFVAATAAKISKGVVVERSCWSGLVLRGMGSKWKSFIVDVGPEDRVIIVDWDHNGFVVDVDGVEGFSWPPGGPMISDVEVSATDEGAEEMEIIVVGVHANENNPVVGAKGEDGRSGKSWVGEFMVDCGHGGWG